MSEAISQVMQGEPPTSPGIARMIIASLQEPSTENRKDYKLTNREKEILTHLAKGKSFKLIAADANISIETVRVHIKNIYEKLQVRSRTEAVTIHLSQRRPFE